LKLRGKMNTKKQPKRLKECVRNNKRTDSIERGQILFSARETGVAFGPIYRSMLPHLDILLPNDGLAAEDHPWRRGR
jgi:hypothetical protein